MPHTTLEGLVQGSASKGSQIVSGGSSRGRGSVTDSQGTRHQSEQSSIST